MSAPNRAGDARVEAARVLERVLEQAASLDSALPESDARLADPRDRALTRAIVYAALRGIYRYRALLALLLAKPLKARESAVEALLLCALAQLDAEIAPGYAVVSGSVAATRALRAPHLAGLANAVLRRFQHERAALAAALPRTPEVQHNHPEWLLARLRRDWPEDWERIVAANNAPAPLWLRVNARRADPAQYAAELEAAGLAPRRDALLRDALVLDSSLDVAALPGFAQGAVSVQDGAAQLAATLLDLAPGLRVLDACAAPGGKTAHALEREPGLAELTALELKPERAKRLEATLARLGLAARVICADASDPLKWWDGTPYDRILIDAPCSGTGVIRRHPDIRLLRRAADIDVQAALQARLLDALWPMLAAGGRLVYATCSVLPEENERQAAAFLARTPGARALDAVPAEFGRAAGAGRQNLTGEGGMDGFFYAVLERSV